MDSNVTPQTWNLKPPKQPEHLKAKKKTEMEAKSKRKIKKKMTFCILAESVWFNTEGCLFAFVWFVLKARCVIKSRDQLGSNQSLAQDLGAHTNTNTRTTLTDTLKGL